MAKREPSKKEESAGPVITARDIVPEMRESYLDYAMSVIVARALPDVRDGLKPVHRRILYTCHEMGLTAASKFRKSAAITGTVVAQYHPHGDAAVYDSLVKMAQVFSYRYPLILGQGNFGSLDGDAPAAMRYTEAKMSRIAGEMLKDIEKDTVAWRPNFENIRNEPTVLPARAPNLLLNGTLGIAVGMATKIPPHNLDEVVQALIYVIKHKNATTEDLLEFVKGPDFPTGGIVFNQKDIHHAYATGRGGVVVRGEAEIVEGKGGAHQIVISSIPYQVNKAELIVRMADLVREKKIDGIRDIRDESTEEVRIVLDLKSSGHPQKVLNALYKHTDLETTFHYNCLALSGGVPKLLSLKDILVEFVEHRREVVRRRTAFLLAEAEARAHILEGLKRALDHIDAVIRTIKQSRDTATAHKNLQTKFKLSDKQAAAILDMRLQRLAALERKKVEDELTEKKRLITEYKGILADPKKILAILEQECTELKERFGDERKTKVVKGGVKNISVEDLVPDVENVFVLTNGGYVKRTDPSEYRRQKRGGTGVVDLNTKEEDFVDIFLTAHTHSDLLFFSDRGKVYQLKMHELPEGKRATKGKSIMNYLSVAAGEKITSILEVPKGAAGKDVALFMATRGGVVKKVDAESFCDVRRSGIVAVKLASGDALLAAHFISRGEEVMLVSKNGQAIRFKESDVRKMGRTASGVRGMRLSGGDRLVAALIVSKECAKTARVLVVSECGFGKKSKITEYKVQSRGGSGIKTAKVSQKTGALIGGKIQCNGEREILAISKRGQVIRMGEEEVSVLGRQTQGVRLMRMRAGDSLASLTFI